MKHKLLILLAFNLLSTAAGAEQRFKDWSYVQNTDKVTNKVSSWIYTEAKKGKTKFGDRPFMGVNCTQLYFGNVSVLDDGDVLLRVDTRQTARKLDGAEWRRDDGTTIDLRDISPKNNVKTETMFRYYKTHFVDSVKAREVYVKFDMFSEVDLNVTFSLQGFTKAINVLQSDCVGIHELDAASTELFVECGNHQLEFFKKNNGREYKQPKRCTPEYFENTFGYDTLK